MGLRLTQGDEKTASVQQLLFPEAPPSPLSSRPKRSAVERSAVQRSFPGNVFRQSVPGFHTSHCQRRPRVPLSVKRAACTSSEPRFSTGNPGSGVERSAVLPQPLRYALSKNELSFADFEWVAQVSLLRPGFLLAAGPGPEKLWRPTYAVPSRASFQRSSSPSCAC